ncbi:unnamed protein product [Staurois parvus]|uniref:Uncharacterized protein n=1 Tax=Staurois parvus TaxID=386267 RepID=A0ABN9DU22_9NEOB|nr:unnamed protein product [Staurois parvus]
MERNHLCVMNVAIVFTKIHSWWSTIASTHGRDHFRAPNVGNASQAAATSTGTSVFIPGRNHFLARNATDGSLTARAWSYIRGFTRGRSHILAMTVGNGSETDQDSWSTKERILVSSHTNASSVGSVFTTGRVLSTTRASMPRRRSSTVHNVTRSSWTSQPLLCITGLILLSCHKLRERKATLHICFPVKTRKHPSCFCVRSVGKALKIHLFFIYT